VRLGELLVHTGVITAGQRDEAVQQQVVFGARLGTNLIELGYASPDQIAHGLARLLRVPAALTHHFAHADPSLLKLIPRELAARIAAYPIAFADTAGGRRLVVCLRNPTDADAAGHLSQAAGTQVLPCAAPELALFEWMERGYGVRRHERYRQAQPGQSQPLPPSDTGRFAAVEQTAALDDELAIDVDVDFDLDKEADMPAVMHLVELDHSDVERDFSDYHAPGKERESALDLGPAAAAAVAAASATAAAPAIDPGPEPMTAAAAIAAIRNASSRSDVSAPAIRFLRHRFAAGVMLIAKDDMALGHRGFGGSFDAETVESILIPLNAPSMFLTACEAMRTCRGAPPSGGQAIHERFFKLFPLDAPPIEVVVTPVVVRDRVVCLLYAHGEEGGPLTDTSVNELEHIARAVSEAYLELIRAARRT